MKLLLTDPLLKEQIKNNKDIAKQLISCISDKSAFETLPLILKCNPTLSASGSLVINTFINNFIHLMKALIADKHNLTTLSNIILKYVPHFEIDKSYSKLIRFVIEAKLDPNQIKNHKNRTLLHGMIQNGTFDNVQYLAQYYPSLVNMQDHKGVTPVMEATEKWYDLPDIIIKTSNFKLRDQNGKNALHYAAIHGREKIIKHILKIDKNLIKEVDNEGNTPLHYLVNSKSYFNVLAKLDIDDKVLLQKNNH